MVRRQRLYLEHIQRRAGDLLGFERRHQIIQDNDRATPDVDQVGRRLHLLELRPLEPLFGLRRVGSGDHHEVAFREQVGQTIRFP